VKRFFQVNWIIASVILGVSLVEPAKAALPDVSDKDRLEASADALEPNSVIFGGDLHLARADYLYPPPQRPGKTVQARGNTVPLSVVLSNIRARYPGKHLDSSLNGNRYRVKWLTPDGRLLVIMADASSGNILSVRGN